MATIGSLVVRIAGDVKPLARSLAGAKTLLGGFAGGIADLGRSVTRVGGVIASAGIVAGMTKAVALAREQEQVSKKLRAVLEATGWAAGFTSSELENMAGRLQDVTNFGDETIINTMALLATFKGIKGEQFEEVTRAALDMTAVLGGSTKGAAIQLGKALNDPIKGVSALSKAGVSFTESQRSMIRTLQESGDLIGAQKIVLAELKSEFGGAAEAMADPIVQLKNAFGDLGETIGKVALPFLREFATDGKASIEDLNESLKPLETNIGLIADAIHGAKIAFRGLQVVVDVLALGFLQAAKWLAQLGALLSQSPAGRDSGIAQWFDDAIEDIELRMEGMSRILDEDVEAFKDKFNELQPSELADLGLLGGLGTPLDEMAAKAEAAAKAAADALNGMIAAAQPAKEFLQGLRDELLSLADVPSNLIELGELIDKGLIDRAGIDEAMGLIDAIEGMKTLKADMALGERLTAQFRTPIEEFQKVIADLDRLLGVGAISDATAQRGFDAALKDLGSSDQFKAPDVFTGRAEVGSAEAFRIIMRARAGGGAMDEQAKMGIDVKKMLGELKDLNAVVGIGVEKLDPQEVAETMP